MHTPIHHIKHHTPRHINHQEQLKVQPQKDNTLNKNSFISCLNYLAACLPILPGQTLLLQVQAGAKEVSGKKTFNNHVLSVCSALFCSAVYTPRLPRSSPLTILPSHATPCQTIVNQGLASDTSRQSRDYLARS